MKYVCKYVQLDNIRRELSCNCPKHDLCPLQHSSLTFTEDCLKNYPLTDDFPIRFSQSIEEHERRFHVKKDC